jgi:DNA-binding response OmpR family regulator
MPTVLIADDEPAIVLGLRDELQFEGFDVHVASDGLEAVAKATAVRPDVLLLDVMLPALNGFEVCRRLRAETKDLWIIMVSARGQEADRITGFEAGADDYVTKPFSLRELVGRIKVAMRRQGRKSDGIRRLGDLHIDVRARRVSHGGVEIVLTRREFDILELLLRRAGEVITRDEFLDAVWGSEVNVTHRTVDTHMAALRRKLDGDGGNREYIQSVRGVGYRLYGNLAESP